MRCINKRIIWLFLLVFIFTGCANTSVSSEYDVFRTSQAYGLTQSSEALDQNPLFAKDLIVTDETNLGPEQLDTVIGDSAGVFALHRGEVLYKDRIFEKIYPASTTKILTAYVAFKYGDLDQEVTVSEHACDQPSDSSVCHLRPGDVLTLRQLLYGLMLRSGNDAAIAIAEGISGDEAAFMDLMNEEANRLGGTRSHFVTPSGMPNEDHYTCVYDMYLFFRAAMQYPEFTDIISTHFYKAVYRNANGDTKVADWENTNRYINGQFNIPDGFTVIGGKTGTTGAAGYCLVLLSYNPDGEPIMSMVFHAGTPYELYTYMNSILKNFAQ